MRLDLPFRWDQQSPNINLALWAVRTGLEYVPVIVGGSAVLACIKYALRILPIALVHPGMGAPIGSIWVLFEFMLIPMISLWPVLGGGVAGAVLFACARLSRSYPETLTFTAGTGSSFRSRVVGRDGVLRSGGRHCAYHAR